MNRVKEIQGLYGPFSMSERVLQKIWLRQDFSVEALHTASGKSIQIVDSGHWNLLEGPDFKDAKLVVDGETIVGDVEIHFEERDWLKHAHETSSHFDRVVLHVVLHTKNVNTKSPAVYTSKGRQPETFYLMPHLNRDLEEYVSDDALLELEQQDSLEWVARFIELPIERRLTILSECAEQRWQQKVRFARKRLDTHGWSEACHQYALEVLGYSRNRAPMSAIALRYPLKRWSTDLRDTEQLFEEYRSDWRLNGLRPANQPKRRLAQYKEIVTSQPNWPDVARSIFQEINVVSVDLDTKQFRQNTSLRAFEQAFSISVFSDSLGDTRMHTLMCDGLLPLAAAAGIDGVGRYWRHWHSGDVPHGLQLFLKQAEVVGAGQPQCNGLNQGALSLFFSHGVV